ncbi:MAG: asparaginase [Planctomycetes bacterium]|nr:asparaginase [Planctomycetota bacterium]MCB9904675.1 asparaginase [Planctomycetota bacterium]
MTTLSRKPQPAMDQTELEDNPVLARVWRGSAVESQHRGAWALTDSAGTVLDGNGHFAHPTFLRSSTKSLQAIPLLETGVADKLGFSDAEVALALASHDAEEAHTRVVAGLLARLGLGVEHLQCGSQPPGNADARYELRSSGKLPSALHNNCSGKHAAFLALSQAVGDPVERYLDPQSRTQRMVRQAVLEMTGVPESQFSTAIDGCSAPTFRLPLQGLATAFARLSTPDGLAPERRAACERMLGAVKRHPILIAGSTKRICTDISRATSGRLFPKVGAEAVYAVGLAGGDRAIAVKIDDGGLRALHAVVITLLERFGFATEAELFALETWRGTPIRNWAGTEVGRLEVTA